MTLSPGTHNARPLSSSVPAAEGPGGNRRNRPAAAGFTLVELLVVILVMSALAGALLPALSRARHTAQAVLCMNNLRELGLAHHLYITDYNGWMVDAGLGHGAGHGNEQKTWVKTLSDYSSARQDSGLGPEIRARSPLDRSPHWGPYPQGEAIEHAPAEQRRRTSYGLNDYLTSAAHGSPLFRRLDQIQQPAALVHSLLMAWTGEFAGADHGHVHDWYESSDPQEVAQAAASQVQLHAVSGSAATPQAVSNWGFLDGHVRQTAFEHLGLSELDNLFDPRLQR